ncbi:MAG: alpha-galactosidase, partial [bacterium]|nr:alpha-galactosidase [bacterium]
MNTIYEKGCGNLTITSTSGSNRLSLERIGCAIEWHDKRDILHRADSLGMAEVRFYREGKSIEAAFETPGVPKLTWKIIDKDQAVILQAGITNTTGEYIRVHTIEPFYMDFVRHSRLELNGGLLQAQLVSQRISDAMLTSVHVFEALYQYNSFYSDNTLALHDKQGVSGLVLGFASIKRMFGKMLLEFDINLKSPLSFRAFSDAENVLLAPGESLHSEELWLSIDGLPSRQMERYAQYTGKSMGARQQFLIPTGWSTWDYYFGDINEQIVLDNIAYLQRDKEQLPLEYIQIDAGYCNGYRDWTEWDKTKFPHGPRWLVERINEYGFKAGLWLVPFYAHPKSRVAREHPEWLVKDIEGTPASSQASAFALDGSHPQVQAWLQELARIITCEWGFEYIKIDGASIIGTARGEHYDAAATGCGAYRQGIEAFRSGMKEGTFFMGGIFNVGIGVIDAMRTGGDVGARWDCSKI